VWITNNKDIAKFFPGIVTTGVDVTPERKKRFATNIVNELLGDIEPFSHLAI
jgi:hypothetical protein